MENPLSSDLNHILGHTQGLWNEIKGQRIFITGGTGFFGCWLLESFAVANERLRLGASALVLTRDFKSFRKKAPHLAENPAIAFLEGDVRAFPFPDGEFRYIIHAAADVSVSEHDPLHMRDTIVEGTKRILDFSRICETRKVLFVSSGAVYGPQPPHLSNIPEDYAVPSEPSDHRSPYGEAKRIAEVFCIEQGKQSGMEAKVARCFTFVGPYMPLHSNYAAGNFILDGLEGRPIRVKEDGTPVRSYLYAADLAVWLWTILIKGKPGAAYNVGSEKALSIAGLAEAVAEVFDAGQGVVIDKKTVERTPPERYVPLTEKARNELGIGQEIGLKEAIQKTIRWCRQTFIRSG